MKLSEIKELMIKSLGDDTDASKASQSLSQMISTADFSEGFSAKVLNRIGSAGIVISREAEFIRNMNFVLKRIALTGAAAILILVISIFLSQGTLSLDAFLGLADGSDESFLYILAGN